MPEVSESKANQAPAGAWSVTRAEDADGRPVRVCALALPPGFSPETRGRIGAILDAAVAASAQGRLSLLSWTEQDGTLYTVEPAPPAQSLGELVASNGPLSTPELIPLLHGIVAALTAMEPAGLRHGWLTPDNVYPGATPQLAGQAWPAVFQAIASEIGGFQWPGSAYAAPETQAGATLDGAAEVWSAAALSCFALTGASPSPSALAALPPAVGRTLGRALDQNPAARYADVKTMVVDLTVEQAIGMSDIADQDAVPSDGTVPDWARDLLRETSQRRDTGRPLVDTVPEEAPSTAAAQNGASPAAKRIDPVPAPAAPQPGRRTASRPTQPAPAAAFDWDEGAPRKSIMPLVVSVIAALFILAGIALTFLKK